jgi:hypothetical protein
MKLEYPTPVLLDVKLRDQKEVPTIRKLKETSCNNKENSRRTTLIQGEQQYFDFTWSAAR